MALCLFYHSEVFLILIPHCACLMTMSNYSRKNKENKQPISLKSVEFRERKKRIKIGSSIWKRRKKSKGETFSHKLFLRTIHKGICRTPWQNRPHPSNPPYSEQPRNEKRFIIVLNLSIGRRLETFAKNTGNSSRDVAHFTAPKTYRHDKNRAIISTRMFE